MLVTLLMLMARSFRGFLRLPSFPKPATSGGGRLTCGRIDSRAVGHQSHPETAAALFNYDADFNGCGKVAS